MVSVPTNSMEERMKYVPTDIPIFFAVAVCSSGECVELTPGVAAEE